MDEVENVIANYIGQNIMLEGDVAVLEPTAPLLESGILDSAGMVELLLFLESEFSFVIPPQDVVPENFDNVNSIAKLVKSIR